MAHPKDVMSLSSVIQALGESLKDYLEIFHVDAMKVSNLNDHAILMAMTRGINSEFGDWLAGKPPTTLERFYSKASQFLRKEEARYPRKSNVGGLSGEAIQSNIAIKQSDDSSKKAKVNTQNKPNQQKGGKDRN